MRAQMNTRDYEQLSAYLDGQLSPIEQTRLEERLRGNSELRSALDELSRTRSLLRMAPRRRAPRNFTLTPEMVQPRRKSLRDYFNLFPALSFASAVATLALIATFLVQLTPGVSQNAPSAALSNQSAAATEKALLPEAATGSEAPPSLAAPNAQRMNTAGSEGQVPPIITWGQPADKAYGMGGGAPPSALSGPQGLGGGGGGVGGLGGGAPDGKILVPPEGAGSLDNAAPSIAANPDQYDDIPPIEGNGPILGVPKADTAGQYLEPLATPLPTQTPTSSKDESIMVSQTLRVGLVLAAFCANHPWCGRNCHRCCRSHPMAEGSLSALWLEHLLSEVNFCIRCGAKLERKSLFGQERPICPACGWVFFADPKVASGVLVEDGERVLLVRRVNEPGRGLWSFPAGFVDAGEDPARAAERECLEETGLAVDVHRLINVIGGREHDRGADIVIVYSAEIVGGDLKAGDDADRAEFFPRKALPPLAFRATKVALGIPE